MLGDIYFTKSLDQDYCRHNDYENAQKYYRLEKNVIETMTLDDIEDPEPNELLKLKQANCFNIGAMGSRIPSSYREGEKNLKSAVVIAHEIKDFGAEKTAWWELSILYQRVGQSDNVKFCQEKEYGIIRNRGFSHDTFYWFSEKSKNIAKTYKRKY